MVTTETEVAQMIRALDAGANEYVMKPFTATTSSARSSTCSPRCAEAAKPWERSAFSSSTTRSSSAGCSPTCSSADPRSRSPGTRSNGRLALQKLTQLQPDVVVMDVEMPEMNGLEALVELRKTHPKLPVIMFSTLTTQGATQRRSTRSSKGATDYVAKPANVGSVQLAIAQGPRRAGAARSGRSAGRRRATRREPPGGSARRGRSRHAPARPSVPGGSTS